MNRFLLGAALMLGGVGGAWSASGGTRVARPTMKVHITQGHVEPDPVAFLPFYADAKAKSLSRQFLEVLQNDLCLCGVFRALNPASFLQSSEQLANKEPNLQSWRVLKARFLICGTATSKGRSTVFKIQVYDVNRGMRLVSFTVEARESNWRRAAHMAADQIYTRVTGENGMFDTRIAYVETVPPARSDRTRTYLRCLKIMDQDGANDTAMTDSRHLVMSPQFSPDGKTIAYLLFKYEGTGRKRHPEAHVYLMDVATKKIRPLLTPAHFAAISKANRNRPVNMTYAPRFSPDGKSICFALIIDGKSAIYTMNIQSGAIRRLTDHVNIDTSPAYSPDGRFVVFTSNRGGREKIYMMNVDGSNVRRVTSGEGKYSQPVFSPRGDLIVFVKQIGNLFYIGVVQPNGLGERLIVSGYMAEYPCWSPNGRFILFVWQEHSRGQQSLCKIDLTGMFMQKMTTPRAVRDCSWSPLQNG